MTIVPVWEHFLRSMLVSFSFYHLRFNFCDRSL